jgi:phosphoserine phosphatase
MSMLLCGGRPMTLRHRLSLSFAVQRLLLARKLHRLSHDTLLRRLQALWQGEAVASALADRLQARLLRLVRPNLAPILRLVTEDVMDAMLATAAAADYALPLGRKLGFETILATPVTRPPDEPCNAGALKRDRVLALLHERGWSERPRIFFNDDLADLPLMQESHAVCWFGDRGGLSKAAKAAPAVRFLFCRDMRPNEMTATIAHLGQSLAAAQLANLPWVFPAARPRASTVL